MKAANQFLAAVSGPEPPTTRFDEVRMESVVLPAGSVPAGSTLASMRRTGVQSAGITRGGRRIVNPGADVTLMGGDEVLLLGTPEQIDAFRAFVRGEP